MEWETAAAQCVVEASGGLVVGLNGEPIRYGKPGLRNPGFAVIGDVDFQWTAFASGSGTRQAFRAFFVEISREAGEHSHR